MAEFTEGEKSLIRETARQVTDDIIMRLELPRLRAESIAAHSENCKHGKKLSRICYIGIGLTIGLGLTNAGLWLKVLGVIG